MTSSSTGDFIDLPDDTAPPEAPPVESNSRQILRRLFQPIYDWLLDPAIEEVQINRPGEIIQRLREPTAAGSIYAPHKDERLSHPYLTMLAHAVANSQGLRNFGPDGTPVVYGTLPGGHRFVAGIGPNIQYHESEIDDLGSIAMVIRQFQPTSGVDLEHYGVVSGKPLPRRLRDMLAPDRDPQDAHGKILSALARGDHILISGATGTGKTTMLRAFARRLDPNLRVVTIEDTRELVIPQHNRVHIVMARSGSSNQLDYRKVVDLVVRMTPDVICAGEISTTNAATIWELMRSGHGHFMTTIHAESAREAISTFITRIGHERPEEIHDHGAVLEEMQQRLRVIQITRDGNRRRVTEIYPPPRGAGGEQPTDTRRPRLSPKAPPIRSQVDQEPRR